MKTTLKDFQETAVRELAKRVRLARLELENGGDPQVVVLSSPTGSGKTVTLCALLERLWRGDEDVPEDLQARFLWLSDLPELNVQSREKFQTHSDIFGATRCKVIESEFQQETFDAGKIYFLNTQKLIRDGLLTKRSDTREITIWDTIANTAKEFGTSFYLVIDEAHRGSTQTRAVNEARTIMQRFIMGYSDETVKLPPIPLVIGMSATPERFQSLAQSAGRVPRLYEIPAKGVVESGLLKENVVVKYPEGASGNVDYTLLEQAVEDLVRYRERWATYCSEENEETNVEPVLVVQVQDGNVAQFSETDLEKVVEVIDRRYYELTGAQPGAGFFAHCFQEQNDLPMVGHNVRKIDPSRIQSADSIRVVFFKTALSTGWDCPRAEVMMSFRKAEDRTNIAQLVGRMVRTPLARRIEKDEFLNTVRLYLPHYNALNVAAVVEKLKDPNVEDATGVNVILKDQEKQYSLALEGMEAVAMLHTLPTYRLTGAPKKANTARLRTLARALVVDKFDSDAEGKAKDIIVDELWQIWNGLPGDKHLKARTFGTFDLRELNISYGNAKVTSGAGQIKEMSPENIDQLFNECGRKLTNGIHMDFDQKYYEEEEFEGDPYAVRLALRMVMAQTDTMPRLEKLAGEQVSTWLQEWKVQINVLPEGKRKRYEAIRAQSRFPEPDVLRLPDVLEGIQGEGDAVWKRHLFTEGNGHYWAKLNAWEAPTVQEELENPDVLFWLRNQPRKPWALCVPYEMGSDWKGCYPDFLFVRRKGDSLVCDIIDPHLHTLDDAVDKAKGLARFAERHGYTSPFGRIELLAEVDGQRRRLDLQDDKTREAVKKINSRDALMLLYQMT